MIKIDSILEIKDLIVDIDAVIFDLDDTLYLEVDYVKSGFEQIGLAFPQVENLSEKLWCSFARGEKPINIVFESEGIGNSKLIEQAISIYRSHIPKIRLAHNVKEMLKDLRERGKKLGIITDGRPEGQRKKIEALKIEELVDKIIITDELGGEEFRKPHPRAFIEIMQTFKVPFERGVYIGDNKRKDFIAPEKLGMKTIWFNNPNGLYY